MIGILVSLAALAVSAFSWITIGKSNGLLVGKSQASITLDKGERDFISPGMKLALSPVGLSQRPITLDKGERDSLSPGLKLALLPVGLTDGSVTIDKGERDLIP